MTTLPNGLKVVFLEDHSTPIVHAEIWYHVGSKNEKAGRTGFAHLFEHMMFKGSKNVEPEGHPSWISSVGGQSNAYTNEDATVFWQTFPAQYLPLVVWLEADRLASLRIDEATFKTEREVVKEERRMRVENQPYGRLNEIVYDQAFTVHPYKHPTIGSMQDLEAASIEDVRAFFRTFYVPANATLDARRRLRHQGSAGARRTVLRPHPESGEAGAARHPRGAAANQGTPGPARRELAASGSGRGSPHHLRRRSGFVSVAHCLQGALRRSELAHLSKARLREADRAGCIRWRQHHRRSESLLRGCDRSARQDDRRKRPMR